MSLALAASASALPAFAAVPRPVPPVAEIVTVKGDEQVAFVEAPAWRVAELRQALTTGDALRTGPYGGLALLFRDETQIRVHRNSSLVVKSVRTRAGAGETALRLDRGAAWSRARPIADTLKMETPAVTAGIRGTDWHLRVEDDGRTTLIVLEGSVELSNEFGAVRVSRGEIAVTEVGKAPTKTILISPKDRPQWERAILPDWIRLLPVTGLTPGRLNAERARLSATSETRRDAALLLDAAEVAYELSDGAAAARHLDAARPLVRDAAPALRSRLRLLEGLLAAGEYRYE